MLVQKLALLVFYRNKYHFVFQLDLVNSTLEVH